MEVAKAGYCQNAAQGYCRYDTGRNLPQRLIRVRSWKAIGRGTDSFYTGVSKCHTVPQDSCGHAGQGRVFAANMASCFNWEIKKLN